MSKEIGQFIGEGEDDDDEGKGGGRDDFLNYIELDYTLELSKELLKPWRPGTTPDQLY